MKSGKLLGEKKIIIANWKMNPQTLPQALRLAEAYRPTGSVQLVVCPPTLFLPALLPRLGKKMAFGAQNCFWQNSGPYTGETSPKSLKALGAKYVILGHSERRKYFYESDSIVRAKISAALAVKLCPIVCLGGGLSPGTSQAGIRRVLKSQFTNCFFDVNARARFVLVFEPTYAISTLGASRAEPHLASSMIAFIRLLVFRKFGRRSADRQKIVYGGSVDETSVKSFLLQKGIDGVLVGAASLRAKKFSGILGWKQK